MNQYFILSTNQLIDTFSRIASGSQFELNLSNNDFNLEDLTISEGDSLLINLNDSVYYEFKVLEADSDGLTLKKEFEISRKIDFEVDEEGIIYPLKEDDLKAIHSKLFEPFRSSTFEPESSSQNILKASEEANSYSNTENIDLKTKFAEWLFSEGKYVRVYKNDLSVLVDRLGEFETAYEEDFGIGIFDYPNHSIDFIISELESNIIGTEGHIGDINKRTVGNGSVKAILGPNNYIKFLKELKQKLSSRRSQKGLGHSKQKPFDVNAFIESCKKAGLLYSDKLIIRFISSLLAKPFVILTGLSGSGKTKLAQAFVQWLCADHNQYRIIPVGADWTNREPLLGYPNALDKNEYIKPDNGVIDLIIEANSNPDRPHFLILDEMNLSHVERYFADFLSVMESNDYIPLHDGLNPKNGVPGQIKLPKNLFIIGTVNIDETTNMFSPKVLDRANTIEFRIASDEMKNFLKSSSLLNMSELFQKGVIMSSDFMRLACSEDILLKDKQVVIDSLIEFFIELQRSGAEFGYRGAMEIYRLISQIESLTNDFTTEVKVDISIMQKLLPKLHGSRRKLHDTLETLGGFCLVDSSKAAESLSNKDFQFDSSEVIYPLSFEKIYRMYSGLIENGFTSYAEA